MNPIQTYGLREAVRAVMNKHGYLSNVDFEFELMAAIKHCLESAGQVVENNHQQATLEALVKGTNKDTQAKTDWQRLFNTSPNWQTKTNGAFLIWLKERQDHLETLDCFAQWWYANDFRGKQGAPPTTTQVQELWPQAFTDKRQGGLQQRTFDLPEGL